ncbi:MAG: hypothetical protein M3R63_16680, partial [Actinomycetota bacterium]|nr:hypothetical protein [Actinomycetota bacterium]
PALSPCRPTVAIGVVATPTVFPATRPGATVVAMIAATPPKVTDVTDARTHRSHLVTDDASTAGRRSGRYEALCGAIVLAASLTTPDRDRCDVCTHRANPPPA